MNSGYFKEANNYRSYTPYYLENVSIEFKFNNTFFSASGKKKRADLGIMRCLICKCCEPKQPPVGKRKTLSFSPFSFPLQTLELKTVNIYLSKFRFLLLFTKSYGSPENYILLRLNTISNVIFLHSTSTTTARKPRKKFKISIIKPEPLFSL